MFANGPTRRGTLAAVAGFAATLAGCKSEPAATPASGALVQGAPAAKPAQSPPEAMPKASGVKISAIAVDTSALFTQNGEATAGWVETELPRELARAFARYMAPDDPNGATLSVEISRIVLASVNGAIDSIDGSATLKGGGATKSVQFDAAAAYVASSADPYQKEQAEEARIIALLQAFARGLPGKFDL